MSRTKFFSIVAAAWVSGFLVMFVISQLHHFEFGFHDHDMAHEHDENTHAHMMTDASMTMGESDETTDWYITNEQDFIVSYTEGNQKLVAFVTENLSRVSSTSSVQTIVANMKNEYYQDGEQLKTWYQNWYGEPIDIKISNEFKVNNQSNLQGIEFERVFIEALLYHEEQMVELASEIGTDSARSEVVEFAERAVTRHGKNMEMLQQTLNTLP